MSEDTKNNTEINLENETKLSIILIYSDGHLYYDFMDKIKICPLANGDLIYISSSDCINKIDEILELFYFVP